MDTREIKVEVMDGCLGIPFPEYGTQGSAGVDLRAVRVLKLYKGSKEVDLSKIKNNIENGVVALRPFERVLLGTGFKMEIPVGYELQIRPRSGTALKRGLTVINSPGTIDSDYRGEVGIIIVNMTPFMSQIQLGEAIAQGVLTPYTKIEFVNDHLSTTSRGEGGYGHTSEVSQAFAEGREVKFI